GGVRGQDKTRYAWHPLSASGLDRGGAARRRRLSRGRNGQGRNARDSAINRHQIPGGSKPARVVAERQRKSIHARQGVSAHSLSNGPVSRHLLSVDTTAEWGSIALVGEQGVIEEVTLHSPDGFAHILFGEIQQLLARQRLDLDTLDAFA